MPTTTATSQASQAGIIKTLTEGAGRAVAAFSETENSTLDYSESSLERLDQAITDVWGRASPAARHFDAIVWPLGAYVGMVLLRHHAGVWHPADRQQFAYLVTGLDVPCQPWRWVEERFRAERRIAAKYRDATRAAGRSPGRKGPFNPAAVGQPPPKTRFP